MTINAHPELPEFDYIRPGSVMEASRFLAEHAGDARPFLGGTDLFVRMRDGLLCPKYLVDLKNLEGMNDLKFDPRQGLTIGAAVNMNRVAAAREVQQYYPLLAEACCSVASYQLRTRATIVGNICNASPAGDTIGACLALDGRLQVYNAAGLRFEPLETFFTGPGQNVLKPGDIVTALQFPLPPAKNAGTYLKLGRNRISDLAIVGVTAYAWADNSLPSGIHFRVCLASVAPLPLVLSDVEAYLSQAPVDEARLQEAARMAEAACRPIDDVRSSARYRRLMVRRLTLRALQTVWSRLKD